jgi:Lytic transglycolase
MRGTAAATTQPGPVVPSERAAHRRDEVSLLDGYGGAVVKALQAFVLVVASWYGPGFYGNHTACGQVFTPQTAGVAHKTLPCGTVVVLSYRGNTVRVPVIDRGPYIAGREFDLTGPAKAALGCPDLCTVEWTR